MIAKWAAAALVLQASTASRIPGEGMPVGARASEYPVHAAADLRADFELMRRAILQSHPGINRYRTTAEIDAIFATGYRHLRGPMTSVQFYRSVLPVIAAIRDGHTQVMLPASVERALRETSPLPPYRFHVARGKIYIAADLRAGADRRTTEGREVRAINGRPAARLIRDLVAAQSGDGTIPSSRIAALRTLRFNELIGLLYGSTPTYRLALAGRGAPLEAAGEPLVVLQERLARHDLRESSHPPAELEFRDDGAIAMLSIRSFGGDADAAGTVSLARFIPDAFEQIRQRNSRSLIIDLRDNGGGRDELGRILLQHLLDRPFRYYRGLFLRGRNISFADHVDRWPGAVPDEVAMPDAQGRLRLTRHPNLGDHQPAANRFGGNVFILMNGRSFSTTAEFLSLVHFHRRATLIGEESGGGYYGDSGGVVLTLTLPHSGLRIRLPMVRYELAVRRVCADGPRRSSWRDDHPGDRRRHRTARSSDGPGPGPGPSTIARRARFS